MHNKRKIIDNNAAFQTQDEKTVHELRICNGITCHNVINTECKNTVKRYNNKYQ